MAGKKEEEAAPRKLKPKKAKHAAHHGGAWKVAYADFITTMMALFLLLWLLSAADQATKNIVAMYFKDPGIFDNAQGRNIMSGSGSSKKAQAVPISEVTGPGKAGQGGSEQRVTMEDVKDQVKKALYSVGPPGAAEQSVLFIPFEQGMSIQVVDNGERPLFAPGQTRLLPEAELILDQIGSVLALLPEFRISVAGHTDQSPFPTGHVYTNWDLSLDRAQAASAIVMGAGVPTSRIDSVAGYADTRLLNRDDPLDARNRRISILLKRGEPDKLAAGAAASAQFGSHAGPERIPVALERDDLGLGDPAVGPGAEAHGHDAGEAAGGAGHEH